MGVDLNLLVALDALLQERSVGGAAQRLGLRQTSLSTALARLRRHFGDELLARTGNSYVLTPLAERLLETTEQALASTDRVFETRSEFVPHESEREFTLVCSDAHVPLLGRALTDLVRVEAPGVTLRFEHSTARAIGRAADLLRSVDAMVLPQGVLSGLPHLDLYPDRFVCVVSATDDPVVRLDTDDLAARPWVVPYHPHMRANSAMRQRLGSAGIEPRVEISTEDFLAVPHLVHGTDRVGLLPERVAVLPSVRAAVQVAEVPLDPGAFIEALWWHTGHERDPAHRWLRQLAVRAGQDVRDRGRPDSPPGHRPQN